MKQNDFNSMRWEDRIRYTAQHPQDEAVQAELARVKNKLSENATPEARNYLTQMLAAQDGVDADAVIGGGFDKRAYDYPGSGAQAIRPFLNSLGVDDSQIGYGRGADGKNAVTLYGKELMKPDLNADGTTYASEESINHAVDDYIAGNNFVSIRDYVNAQPRRVSVNYRDGMININGRNVQPKFIRNGVAYLDKSTLDQMINSADPTSADSLLQQVSGKYDPLLDTITKELGASKDFSYDFRSDPIYQEFEKFWTGQADRKYDDTLAQLESQAGGLPSLGAMAAAGSNYGDMIGQLAGYRKQFRDDAYGRYEDGADRMKTLYDTVGSMKNKDFENAYKVYSDSLKDFRDNQDRAQDFEETQFDQKMDSEKNDRENALFAEELEGKKLSNAEKRITNDVKGFEADLQRATYRGYFTAEELSKWGLDPSSTPYTAEQMLADLKNRAAMELDDHKTANAVAKSDHATQNQIRAKQAPTAAQLAKRN